MAKKEKSVLITWDMAREIAGGPEELRQLTSKRSITYQGVIATLTTGAILATKKDKKGRRVFFLSAIRWRDIDAIIDPCGRVKKGLVRE